MMTIDDLSDADVTADLALLLGESSGAVDNIVYAAETKGSDLVVTAGDGTGRSRVFVLAVSEER